MRVIEPNLAGEPDGVGAEPAAAVATADLE
jgi:hypothetical protein